MRNDPAGTLSRMVRSVQEKVFHDLHVGFPCKVISFDDVKCSADVQPLIRSGEDPAILQGIPALGQRLSIDGADKVCKPALKKGDVVFVVCADRELRNAMTGNVATVDSVRMHDSNDAVIVGVFGCSL